MARHPHVGLYVRPVRTLLVHESRDHARRATAMKSQTHRYDDTGVCIYCDRCRFDWCCRQGPCDRRAIERFFAVKRIIIAGLRVERMKEETVRLDVR